MRKQRYELRVYGPQGASADIVEVRDGRYTVIARATIPSKTKLAVLEWHPIAIKRKRKKRREKKSLFISLLRKLKPSRVWLNPLPGAEWKLKDN